MEQRGSDLIWGTTPVFAVGTEEYHENLNEDSLSQDRDLITGSSEKETGVLSRGFYSDKTTQCKNAHTPSPREGGLLFISSNNLWQFYFELP
jgi:hypothetical protein